jgi:tRNA-splicing ligase RtcB
VAATRLPDGVISPGGIGYDINCGVRLLSSNILREQLDPHLGELADALVAAIPSGLGKGSVVQVSQRELEQVMVEGAEWAVRKGLGTREDLERCEERGRMAGADPAAVSKRAKQRGRRQVGSLGSGNHFLEVDLVEEVYEGKVAERFGLVPGQIAVQIHSGSRGFGHQIASDYVRIMQKAVSKYGITLPDRELVCAPFSSSEGQSYFGAMACAANFAWANRLSMAGAIRRTFEQVLAGRLPGWQLTSVYDVAHNIGKLEEHQVGGRQVRVCVHRKGATRAFGPKHPDVPAAYRDVGQPVLVPGDMGSASYVLVGTNEATEMTFGSSCHGAGRLMSRSAAKRSIRGDQLRRELEGRGIRIRTTGRPASLAEEAPDAYKDVDRVVEVVHTAGIARKVARLRPLIVVKG